MSLERTLFHTKMLASSRNKHTSYVREDTLNISPILNETSILKTLNDSSLRQVLSETSIAPNAENAGECLDEAFYEIIQSSRSGDVLETLSRLAQLCCESLEVVEPWNRYSPHNYWLAEEASTWKLLYLLHADSVAEQENMDRFLQQFCQSQQTLVEAYSKCDPELRLLNILVDWLELTAKYQEEATRTCAPMINNTVHWGNTLQELLLGSSFFNKDKNKSMVTCIDPDAPRRQQKIIHSVDQQDDNDLCKRVFTEIRCGKFEEAVSLCVSAGQAWRAAVLYGWRHAHYLPREDPESKLEMIGNPTRVLWKWCCLGIANCQTENIYYRAAVGILSGHIESAVLACRGSWEDLLWAHLKVQIEERIDTFIHTHHLTAHLPISKTENSLRQELQIDAQTLPQIFDAVNALMDGKKESYYQTCQKHLMLGQVKAIMQESQDWTEHAGEQFIRFLAHLVLVLRLMGKDPDRDMGDEVLEKYICQLINKSKLECPQLVAYYVSNVPVSKQIQLYAEFLNTVSKSDHRPNIVKAGIHAGIDVTASACVAIKKAISEIQQGYGNMGEKTMQMTINENDKALIAKVISSLEWLVLIPDQTESALWLSNAIIRTFIFIGNINAASECITYVNETFPALVKSISPDSSELREHLGLNVYLKALDAFATWYRHYISGQPKDVEPLPENASFSDKVHHEQKCAVVKEQRARWENTMKHHSRHTKMLLYEVLKFPGGWLVDDEEGCQSSNFSDEEKTDRLKQLDTLRRLCIPEITFLILKILQSDNQVDGHKEAMKLSDLIAAENRQLYKVFNRNKLTEMIEKLKDSSLFLLENGLDMFGYQIENDE